MLTDAEAPKKGVKWNSWEALGGLQGASLASEKRADAGELTVYETPKGVQVVSKASPVVPTAPSRLVSCLRELLEAFSFVRQCA